MIKCHILCEPFVNRYQSCSMHRQCSSHTPDTADHNTSVSSRWSCVKVGPPGRVGGFGHPEGSYPSTVGVSRRYIARVCTVADTSLPHRVQPTRTQPSSSTSNMKVGRWLLICISDMKSHLVLCRQACSLHFYTYLCQRRKIKQST